VFKVQRRIRKIKRFIEISSIHLEIGRYLKNARVPVEIIKLSLDSDFIKKNQFKKNTYRHTFIRWIFIINFYLCIFVHTIFACSLPMQLTFYI
jgi:hypothetical protein